MRRQGAQPSGAKIDAKNLFSDSCQSIIFYSSYFNRRCLGHELSTVLEDTLLTSTLNASPSLPPISRLFIDAFVSCWLTLAVSISRSIFLHVFLSCSRSNGSSRAIMNSISSRRALPVGICR